MKKTVLSFAVLAAALMAASCTTSTKTAEDEGAAIKAKIENCSDPDSLKIYAAEAQAYADKLVKSGDDAAAKAYLEEVTPVITSKAPQDASLLERLKIEADSAVMEASEKAEAVAAEAKEKAEDVKDKAKTISKDAVEKGKETVEKGKEAVSNTVEKGKEAVSNTAEKGKEAVSNAAQQGADKVKNLLGK